MQSTRERYKGASAKADILYAQRLLQNCALTELKLLQQLLDSQRGTDQDAVTAKMITKAGLSCGCKVEKRS
jgi:hypothetical protein